MKKITQIAGMAFMASLAVSITGCTTQAGPFVTDISSDGKGNIVVEKNTVTVNGFTGDVSLGEHPTQQVIRVAPAPAQQ